MNLSQILEKKHKRPKRRRVLRPTRLSKRSEVWYRDQLLSLVKALEDKTLEVLSQQTLTDDIKVVEKIARSRLLDDLVKILQELSIESLALRVATGMVARADQQNKKTISSTLKEAFNIDVTGMLGEKAVQETLELSVRENVNLIQSIKTNYINDIGDVVRESVITGQRHTDMVAEIRDRGQVSESRARLIARDQTAKLNTSLTKARHESLGISMYIFGGAIDERKRKSHAVMIGKLCRYDDPTVYSDDEGETWKKRSAIKGVELHPGEDYQCRCACRPFIKLH